MELLRQNWAWIALNPWGFTALVVVAFGLGWGAARLFYSERIELLKLKVGEAGKTASGKAPTTKFQYKTNGRHGPNVLATSTHDAEIDQRMSFQAYIPEGQQLHVILHGPPMVDLGQTPAAWGFNVVGVVNWVASTYQESTTAPLQHFNAESGQAEMQFFFWRTGDVRIEVFEGDSTNPSWSKSIRVSGRGNM